MKICVVRGPAYPVFDSGDHSVFGGAETRAVEFATSLSNIPGISVTFVVDSPKKFSHKLINNIQVINSRNFVSNAYHKSKKYIDRKSEFPYIRFRSFHHSLFWCLPILLIFRKTIRLRSPKYWKLVDRIDADFYLCFGINHESANTIFTLSKCSRRKAVLFIIANNDVDPSLNPEDTKKKHMVSYCIKKCDSVVTQSSQQNKKLMKNFNIKGTILENPINVKTWSEPKATSCDYPLAQTPYFLWIGRADRHHKRPHLCLKIAKQCKDLNFVMIVNPQNPDVERELSKNAPENVTIIDHVHHEDMPYLIHHSCGIINTSCADYEGFPNTFLQASASGVPIVSLEVGKDYLANAKAGFCANGNLNKLSEYLMGHQSLTGFDKDFATQYVLTHHDTNNQVRRLLQILRSI